MIVILTALQGEYLAVRQHLAEPRVHRHPAGTVFEVGVLAGHPDRPVALAAMGEGNASAATITERAIAEFTPSAVLFVGIAGALGDWLNLGDVVVATRVYGYHGGSSEDGAFRTRPRAWDVAHGLEQLARVVDRAGTWRPAGSTASVHFNPIASGEVLLNSRGSALARLLRDHYNDAVAIEMESAGGALASFLNEATPAITIRSISDYANGDKEFTDRTGAPQLAADNAAAFAAALIVKLGDPTEPPNRDATPPKYGTITNTASGQASVVAQIGVVNGPVQFGTPKPADGQP